VLTGTPSGIGNAREPAVFLAAGDIVVTRGGILGDLSNAVTVTPLT
jgi:2-keto-4-pentenoate hydratase/2-oxohepta-3-ene-1,7-dioic acid hydratase in catechol pathway